MKISILFVGTLNDGGFNQCALSGIDGLSETARADIQIVDGIPYDPKAMSKAMATAAAQSDGVVFVGGQGNLVTPPIAMDFPDCSFAVVQGNIQAANIASYDVLQEQSAFLAGVFAARMTQTGTVAHLSGHRVVPGLKGRAAFVSGVRHVDDSIRVLTGFCGTQDDSPTTEAWAAAMSFEKADFLFTMLNGARAGAIAACRATGMRQIGNATNWCAIDPTVFAASAMARVDFGVAQAVTDMFEGKRPAAIQKLGLADNAVELAFAPDIPASLQSEIASVAELIKAQKVTIATQYHGPEFELEPST